MLERDQFGVQRGPRRVDPMRRRLKVRRVHREHRAEEAAVEGGRVDQTDNVGEALPLLAAPPLWAPV